MTESVTATLDRLARKLRTEYRQSELDIAIALAEADGPLTIEELAREAEYTERTIKKRVGTLEERLHGAPLLERTEDGKPYLHPELARAVIREIVESE